MKKLGMILIGTILAMNLVYGQHGRKMKQTTFSANRGQTIAVIVDGRLINHHASEVVRLHLRPGERNIKVKIYNRRGRLHTVVRRRVRIKHGQSNHFALSNNRFGELALKRMGTTVYHRSGHDHHRGNGHRGNGHRGGRTASCDVSYY
jgi:hypothetical protein